MTYKNNEFDIIGLAAEDLATVQADPVLNAEANIYPGSCTFAVMFPKLKEPFTDPKVREAFAYGLDRDGWVTDVLKGLGYSDASTAAGTRITDPARRDVTPAAVQRAVQHWLAEGASVTVVGRSEVR